MTRSISRGAASGLALALALTEGAAAQTQSSDLARQHLESGVQFYAQQKYKQALNDFSIIVSSMPDTDYADDALLRMGQYYLEVEENFPKARENFDAVLQKYATTDSAPGAYYYIGLTHLRSTRGREGIDDALANFQRVSLYAKNAWISAALYGTGKALERGMRWQEAVDAYSRVTAEYPSSPWSGSAQLAYGTCMVRLGDPMRGMVDLQQVRNRFPQSPEAGDALGLLTLLYRLYAIPKLGGAVEFKLDPTFTLNLTQKLKDVQGVAVTPTSLYVLDGGRKQLLNFDWSGKLVGSTAAVDPRGVTVDARGTIVVANEKGVLLGTTPQGFTVPDEKGPKPLEAIRAVVRDRLGDLYLYDADQKRVLRFDRGGKLLGPFPNATPREVVKLELDANGDLFILDKKDRTIGIYRPDGQALGSITLRGQGYDFKKPVDMALDPAGFLYVLDQESAQVAVYDPAFKLVARLLPSSLGAGVLKKPAAIDVNESGDLFIYDDELKSVVKLH